MMIKTAIKLITILLFFIYNSTLGQKSNHVLFSIDDKKISSDEFTYVYLKNNIYNDSIPQDRAIREYLELFVNFKLKVQEAYDMGLDTTKTFLNEFNMYKEQLTEPYLKEKEVSEQLVREAFSRLKEEVNASHILIRTPEGFESDTIRAYEKITNIYSKALNNEDFDELALEFSEDPSARQNKGNLGYFTALQMVYPFENAAYQTPVGEVSNPFRTRFGYHIIKVNDRRPSKGEIEVAHIMIRFPEKPTNEGIENLHTKANEIYDVLLNGADWNQTCSNYSEDINTKNNGGKLSPFSYGRMIPSFAEAAFSLSTPGEITEPVRTPHGWHIIKLIRKIPVEKFDIMKPDLEKKIKRDSRSELSKQALINRLKKENNYAENTDAINQIQTDIKLALDSGIFQIDTAWTFKDTILFSIASDTYSGQDFANYINRRNPGKNKQSYQAIRNWFKEFSERELISYEKSHLEDKYNDYRMLVNEYREGILLFERMEKKVWNLAIKDTTGLINFFNNHRESYQWDERIFAHIFRSPHRDILDSVKLLTKEDPYPVNNVLYVFKNTDDADIYDLIDSVQILYSNDTTMYVEFVTSKEDQLHIKENLVDSTDAMDWYQKQCIWKIYDKNEIRIRFLTSSKKYLETVFNQNSTLNLQVESGFFEKKDRDFLGMINWASGEYELSIEEQEYYILVVSKIPVGLKALNETRGKVISDYQEFLEFEWIKELKNRYKVIISRKELKKVIKGIEKS